VPFLSLSALANPDFSCVETRFFSLSRHCASVLQTQVPKLRTDLDISLLYILTLGTYSKFARKINFLALGVCFPQPCSSAGRRFAASRSRLQNYQRIVSFPPQKFDEMVVNWIPLRIRVRSRNTQPHLNIITKWWFEISLRISESLFGHGTNSMLWEGLSAPAFLFHGADLMLQRGLCAPRQRAWWIRGAAASNLCDAVTTLQICVAERSHPPPTPAGEGARVWRCWPFFSLTRRRWVWS